MSMRCVDSEKPYVLMTKLSKEKEEETVLGVVIFFYVRLRLVIIKVLDTAAVGTHKFVYHLRSTNVI
jgi:hypothetical protein